MTAFNKSVLWLNHRNLAGCGKLRVFRPERETARSAAVPFRNWDFNPRGIFRTNNHNRLFYECAYSACDQCLELILLSLRR